MADRTSTALTRRPVALASLGAGLWLAGCVHAEAPSHGVASAASPQEEPSRQEPGAQGPGASASRIQDPDHPWNWSNEDSLRGPGPEGLSHRTFRSELANTDIGYWIYLPPSYGVHPAQQYPAVYWLHGIGGNEGTGAHLSARLDAAIRAGRAPEVIMVFVNGGAGSFYVDSADGRFPVESIFTRELIPYIDARYRTISERRGRAIEGFSMGGMGALKFAAKYPDLFSSIVAYGGAMQSVEATPQLRGGFFFRLMFGGDEGSLEINTPLYWLQRNRERIVESRLAIRIVAGGDDGTRFSNYVVRDALQRSGVPFSFVEYPGVRHVIDQYYGADADAGLEFHARAFSGARGG